MISSGWTNTVKLDALSLGVFRLMLGVVVLLDLIARSMVFEPMHTEFGLAPFETLAKMGRSALSLQHFSLHLLHPSYAFQLAMLVISFGFAVCLAVGWKTRVAVIACWVLHVSVMTRSPFYGAGDGVALNVLLFWAMYLPLGDRLSVDSRSRQASADPWSPVAMVGSTCYLIHVCLIYLCASYAKGSRWRDGEALLDIMNVEMIATEFGHSLTKYPELLRFLTSATFYVEAIGPCLLLVPFFRQACRGIGVILFLGLHAGIAATCDIGLFPFISMVMWLPFVPGAFWQWVGSLRRARGNGDAAISAISSASSPSVSPAPNSLRRSRISFALQSIAIAFAICTIVSAVLYAVPGIRKVCRIPVVRSAVMANLSFTKLTQSWGIFVFGKNPRDGWFVVEGTLSDGRTIDVLRNGSPVDWSKPPLSGPKRLSVVWRTYLYGQELGSGSNLDRFTVWLNRDFQKKQSDGLQLQSMRVVFMEEPAPGYGQDETVKPITIWSGKPGLPTNQNGS